jgi:hypothetical protein
MNYRKFFKKGIVADKPAFTVTRKLRFLLFRYLKAVLLA